MNTPETIVEKRRKKPYKSEKFLAGFITDFLQHAELFHDKKRNTFTYKFRNPVLITGELKNILDDTLDRINFPYDSL